jgi:hypothetical protein
MALASGSLFNVTATATTGNVNGAGFNISNANFPVDGVIASGTSTTPTLTSATYTFVAGDVGAAIYLPTQTNIVAGFYPITIVSAGVATINAAIGAAWQLSAVTGMYAPSTSAGCATIAAPTGIKYGVNYAMQDTAVVNGITDFTAVGASTTLSSATANFTPVMVGNFFHQTTTGTGAFGVVGWYEIVSYTNSTTVVLDRTENSGTASVNCTGYVGGAGRLNGLEDTFQAMLPSASMVWVKNGTYTLSAAISTSSTNCTATLAGYWIGYNAVVGDTCNGANRPVIAAAANAVTFSQNQSLINLSFTTTTAAGISSRSGCKFINCYCLNSSPTAARVAFSLTSSNGNHIYGCEAISQNGIAISPAATFNIVQGNYIHDSANGISNVAAINYTIINNIIEACSNAGVNAGGSNAGGDIIIGNTIYGREGKIGTGITFGAANSPNNQIIGNILYGLATGINVSTGTATSNLSLYNNFFNNTTDVSNWVKGATDLAVDPQFAGASQVTGTTGSGSGSVITDTNANFNGNVTDNVDFVRQVSGTGATVGTYLITSHTNTTLTVNNTVGTNATADRVYYITHGHNFQIGTNLKGLGFPNFTNTTGSQTTSYPDVGAVQRQETSSGSAGGSYTFVG